jgi:hypothetical protein
MLKDSVLETAVAGSGRPQPSYSERDLFRYTLYSLISKPN